ncbi:hypothetical protein DFJ73DRAFT_826305 [Zopfochytrium polystomum]|nr:hypothetical protein DFJ73DRAFT_826305 [Zopfochytrium polystomum]
MGDFASFPQHPFAHSYSPTAMSQLDVRPDILAQLRIASAGCALQPAVHPPLSPVVTVHYHLAPPAVGSVEDQLFRLSLLIGQTRVAAAEAAAALHQQRIHQQTATNAFGGPRSPPASAHGGSSVTSSRSSRDSRSLSPPQSATSTVGRTTVSHHHHLPVSNNAAYTSKNYHRAVVPHAHSPSHRPATATAWITPTTQTTDKSSINQVADVLPCSRPKPPRSQAPPPKSLSSKPSQVAQKASSPKARKEPKQKTLWKTEFCNSWRETGECRFGQNCDFAHSEEELRVVERPANWKTKPCLNFFTNGYCQYGRRCGFIHQGEPTPVTVEPVASTATTTLSSCVAGKAQASVGRGRGSEAATGEVDLLELMSLRIARMEAQSPTSVMSGGGWRCRRQA